MLVTDLKLAEAQALKRRVRLEDLLVWEREEVKESRRARRLDAKMSTWGAAGGCPERML